MKYTDTLEHLLTAYDRRMSRRRGYNPHAMARYFEQCERYFADERRHEDPEGTLKRYFTHNGSTFDLAPVRKFAALGFPQYPK